MVQFNAIAAGCMRIVSKIFVQLSLCQPG